MAGAGEIKTPEFVLRETPVAADAAAAAAAAAAAQGRVHYEQAVMDEWPEQRAREEDAASVYRCSRRSKHSGNESPPHHCRRRRHHLG
jgi:hypothetical protein